MSAENTLKLPEEISIANVGDWQDKLAAALQDASSLTLDAAELSRVDTAGVQLLAVLFKQAQSSGVSIGWSASSATLETTAGQLGLKSELLLN
jgi:anti-anti-sigma regulatory factor